MKSHTAEYWFGDGGSIRSFQSLPMPNKPIQDGVSSRAKPALSTLVEACVAGWLIPGLGHLLLGRRWRALILLASIVTMFVMGVAMQGKFFFTGSGSYLETLGYFGELSVGIALPGRRASSDTRAGTLYS